MNDGRIQPAGTVLPDGRVLVAGGGFPFYPYQGFPCEASAELYDPGADRWTRAGNMSDCRFGHTASLLRDGRVLLVGGTDFTLPVASADLYTPLAIARLELDPRSFSPGTQPPGKTGTIVSYTDSRKAKTTFTVLRPARGRLVGGGCVAPAPKNRPHSRCTRRVPVGSFVHMDAEGPNGFRFAGRVGGHALEPGVYWLAGVPRDGSEAGLPVARKFTIRR
jgi:hypothetical protein